MFPALRVFIESNLTVGTIMTKMLRCAALACAAVLLTFASAQAQDRRQNEPGQFDFYVLALSWSPSFCEAAAERPPTRSNAQQCGSRPYSFVVHGLWPQYEQGFPEFCQRDPQRLDRNIVSSMLDLMPSTNLIFHEWQQHGGCSGLSAHAYFDLVRKTRAAVKIPEDYLDLAQPLTVTPEQVEAAFVKANPGLTGQGLAVVASRKRLSEVRICVDKDSHFRDCPEIAKRSAKPELALVMPPARGGDAAPATDASTAR
jgi:ribonuclease T2